MAPRSCSGRITIARRPLAATTMTKAVATKKSDVECSASSSSSAESFVLKVKTNAVDYSTLTRQKGNETKSREREKPAPK